MPSQTESSDRWKRQCEMFHEALEHEPSERLPFLEKEYANPREMMDGSMWGKVKEEDTEGGEKKKGGGGS